MASVTAPPYDVLDRESAASLSDSDPHNVVRLVLPDAANRASRDAMARQTLDDWLADGTLLRDDVPALYIYEQAVRGQVILLGIIGALALLDPADRVVLPHEDVMPWPVADRASLQNALEAHVEPIWLVYDGGGPASQVVGEVTSAAPMSEATTADGVRHRLWTVANPEALQTVADDLADRQALIADGHHRYAAYRDVQQARHAQGRGSGPWDAGLALLVDLHTHAPRVGAIHRVVAGLSLAAIADDLRGTELVVGDPSTGWSEVLATLTTGNLLLVDADGAVGVLALPTEGARRAAFTGGTDQGHSDVWQRLDTAFLHDVLLPAWGVGEDAVTYHHEAAHAVRSAARSGGLAVLMAPVDVADVLALAALGERMPRKSTSFGPKPRSGFVLRSIATD